MKKFIFLHLLWLFFLPLNSFGQDKIISFTTKIGFDAKLGLNGVYTSGLYSAYVIHAELLIGWRF